MKEQMTSKKGTISLPVQKLNWKLIEKTEELKKIVFQFDVSMDCDHKIFSLVAYPAYRIGGKWKFGKKIPLAVQSDTDQKKLDLPLTIGNLELKYNRVEKFFGKDVSKLTFTPFVYKENPHVAYGVSDGISVKVLTAKPCPPARPSEDESLQDE